MKLISLLVLSLVVLGCDSESYPEPVVDASAEVVSDAGSDATVDAVAESDAGSEAGADVGTESGSVDAAAQ